MELGVPFQILNRSLRNRTVEDQRTLFGLLKRSISTDVGSALRGGVVA